MKNNISISLVVPCYNCQKYLKKLFESLRLIKYDNFEIIFVNDGSTDDTLKFLKTESLKHKNWKTVDIIHSGLSAARLAGIESAKFDYVMFLDSDDIVNSNYLSVFANGLIDDADIVTNSIYIHKSNEHYIQNIVEISPFCFSNFEALELLIEDVKISSFFPNKLFKKDFLLRNYRIFPLPYEDVSVMHELFLKSIKIISINVPVYHYYIHPNSLATTKSNYKYQYLANKKRFEFLIENNLQNIAEKHAVKLLNVILQFSLLDWHECQKFFKYNKKIFLKYKKFIDSKKVYRRLKFYFLFPHLFFVISGLKKVFKFN